MSERVTPLDERIEEAQKILSENPDDVSALMAYGEANLLRGRALEAMKSYQRLVAIQPDTVDASLALGKIYLDNGLLTEAFGIVSRVLDAAPANIEGQILLRRLQKSVKNGNVAADLEQSLARYKDYLPSGDELRAQREKLEAERAALDGEIADQQRAVEESRSEPAVEFTLQMSRARRARVEEAIAEVEQWERHYHALEEERDRALREEEQRQQEAREAEEAERLRVEDEERARQQAEAEEAERQRQEEEARLQAEREAEEAAAAAAAAVNNVLREREEAYERIGHQLAPLTSTLMKTKGVIAVLVLSRDGHVVHKTDDGDSSKYAAFVTDAIQALGSEGDGLGVWQFWVLEFSKGILVLQRVSADYYLLVVGQAGSNFGVLTWTIEKNKAQLESVLADAPPIPEEDSAS